NQRDKGCVICHAPPIYCDAHHLISWQDGGVTSLTNLVLLCRVDHNSLHDGHWTITIIHNQVHVTRPTWANPPPRNTSQKPDQPSTTPATAPAPTATTPWPAPAPADMDPAVVDTHTDPAVVGTGADPAVVDTGADLAVVGAGADPAVVDTSADPALEDRGAGSAVVDSSIDAASVTTLGRPAASGPLQVPRLNRPNNDDAPWGAADEAAGLDPWGDRSARAASPEQPAVFDPWADSA
ncbi:HNH endonuclease signature motif containing protein, partial [Kribbella ginsengisoli]|uniref:HNH endonuclease signature motif containing protein n=1 Tax=Kribbella ginsengisoli TaxID=363865 RepID=UPI0031D098D0